VRKTSARNVGTVALGTVLLGLGCTQRNEADRSAELAFPEAEKSDPGARPRTQGYPEPEFGPLGRKAIAKPDPSGPALAQFRSPVDPLPAGSDRKSALLATASEGTIATAREPRASGPPSATSPAATVANDAAPADRADPVPAAEPLLSPGLGKLAGLLERALAGADAEPESAAPAPLVAVTEPVEWPEVDFTPDPAPQGAAEAAGAGGGAFAAAAQSDAPAALAQTGPIEPAAEGSPAPSPVRASSAGDSAAASAPAPVAEPATPAPVALASADPIPAAPRPSPSPASGPEADAAPPPARADTQLALESGYSEVVRRRSIPARSGAAPADDAASTPAAQPATMVPDLASVVPPRRSPIPMTTAVPPQPRQPVPAAANDDAAPSPSATPTAAMIPAARTTPTLGLGNSALPATPAAAGFVDNPQSAFTASAQPPELSYQDELILEVKVKGIDATDTVIAYGSRAGVYLPLGTLARILDIAIAVGDNGNYANGWVLSEQRTLTIDLHTRILTLQGKETALAADAAVAFDGELYIRADQFERLMPLRIVTDLRSQAILIETLEPFPFEERLRREAERQRLASRANPAGKVAWPRQETPYLFASVPVAGVELRAMSDSTVGPRLEGNAQLAGDLGFLTAQAYLGGDTIKGLTTSLIEVGRKDPDAQLLGPLQATEFSVGDVSTLSMPIGLRSVTGRGATITNMPPESFSVFEKIDLRGILQDGYEVELYRNDILVGSTREAVNGQYEFLQIPVDFGLNVFRLVFFGPQGQRSEEVRRISVGDGRLPAGKLVYRLGAVQKDENVLGVRDPNYNPPPDFGDWRASAELAYGLSPGLTALASGAWFETPIDTRWMASAGIRTGIGAFAIKADAAIQNRGALAFSGGVAGRFGNSAVTLAHTEYSGDFIDETRAIGSEILRRSTELDFNTSLDLGSSVGGLSIPLTARVRRIEGASGRTQTNAALRASTRTSGLLLSNTFEYSHSASAGAKSLSQLFGNFDLATAGRSKTRGRLSVGYQLLPNPDLVTAGIEVDHAIDQDTAIRGSLSYAFRNKSPLVGVSAVRDFERFTVALDGNYGFRDDTYSVGLRLGFSFGRDPLRGNFFVARPGLAGSGGASVRAFRDMDGDGAFGPGDSVLPEVDFASFNQTATTGEDGIARLSRLGEGRPVAVQVDTSTLPDIDLAPVSQGIEIVPRPGRIHSADFPIVALSEVDGTVTFSQDGKERGVSGVRLQLRNADGKIVAYARTEIEGYYFFERVLPGSYTVELDPEQSQRLNLCADQPYTLKVGYEADLIQRDIDIAVCE
jgi:hypothetical protein